MTSKSYSIVELGPIEAEARLVELADILVDVVAGGASVNFMAPFMQAEALAFWQGVVSAVADRRTILLAALLDDRAVGTVQLSLATPPNQPHRADVAKLLVHRQARRLGIGRALIKRVEEVARQHDRTLLTLDTLTGTAAEQLYLTSGYVKAGIIPGYAYLPDGATIGDTVIFYKHLQQFSDE